MFRGDLTTLKGRTAGWLDSVFVDHAIFRFPWHNFATVVPGRLYRANHPTPAFLKHAQKNYGLRTIINLRGERFCGSNALSREAADNLNIEHIYAPLESRGAPHRDRLLRLAEIFRTMREPALIHCKSGADRAGLAAGFFLLLNGGTSADALAQLSWRYGHFSRSRTGILDAFFRRYAEDAEGRISFLTWLCLEYDEPGLRRDFTASRLASFVNDRVLVRE
jgi:protein tyrosine/serine phosphatase